ncbi:MAG: polysaccharide biosynthesis tyrosine autokinase [Leptolyngbyaceae cyanobacterium RM1_1_2]|nr:polysaccharide biosynthesis tyrosine autokinase [Leptolyngbyaceae cyanobacterium RM1_1_2]
MEPYQPIFLNGNDHSSAQILQLPMSQAMLGSDDDDFDLRQALSLFRRRALLVVAVMGAVLAAAVATTFTQTSEYEGKFQLLVEPVTAEDELAQLTPSLNLPQMGSGLDYDTQIQVLKSPELLSPIVAQMQQQYPELDYDALIEALTISQLQDTKILEVRYRDADTAQIKAVLDQLSSAYLAYSLNERKTNLRQGIQFVNDQLPQLEQRVNQLQGQLQTFRQQYNFISPDTQAEEISQQRVALLQQRLNLDQELAATRSQWQELQQSLGTIAVLKNAPVYEQLVGRIRELEATIAKETTRFTDENPEMAVLQEERQNLLPILQDEAQRVLEIERAEIGNNIQSLESRSSRLSQSEAVLAQQIQQLPALARQYADLERELQIATESLNRFLTTRETLQIEGAQAEIPWQVLDAPDQPEVPVSPNIPRNLVLGFTISLLLGIVAALIAEKLDTVFHSADELKEKTQLPVLGTIPFCRQMSFVRLPPSHRQADNPPAIAGMQSASAPYENHSFIEAFRALHASIRFLGSDKPVRSLTISSALSGDGKSTVAINLAETAAAMGQRVLLIDADLRQPQIHTRLGLPNFRGLSNLISARLSLRQVIQQSPKHENLYVITSGSIPPDPTKLLASQKMKHLVNRVDKVFDLIIYDTPPLASLVDASLLATHMDGVVLVVSLDKTHSPALMQTLERLKLSRIPILGTVINGVKRSAMPSYDYYYHQRHSLSEEPVVLNGAVHNGNGAVSNGRHI